MPIRILQITSSLNKGSGVANVILNWHRNINRDKVQFDYLYFSDTPVIFEQEIKDLGGSVYKLPYPSVRNLYIFIKSIVKFFKFHRYETIHSHLTQFNFFFFPIAKFFGVKNILLHAHTIKYSNKFINGLRNRLMLGCVRYFITHKLACSDKSGAVLFGKNSKFTIINNAIEIDKFKYNPITREEFRTKLNINDNFVIGHVGRFTDEKNHIFIIDIFLSIYKTNNDARLILVGTGVLEDKIKNYVKCLNLENNVIFTGVIKDVYNFYQVMDCFIFPSKHEGFGIVAIEAQSCGLPCLISDAVPENVNVVNTTVASLNSPPNKWAELVCQKMKTFKRKDESNEIIKAGFDIKTVAEKIENIYMEIEK